MKELVHNRELSIQTYDVGDHCMLLEGPLIDHQCRPKHDEAIDGSRLVHDMVVRLKVR